MLALKSIMKRCIYGALEPALDGEVGALVLVVLGLHHGLALLLGLLQAPKLLLGVLLLLLLDLLLAPQLFLALLGHQPLLLFFAELLIQNRN